MQETGGFIQVFVTTGNKEDAQSLAATIVARRLAACAQVVGPISSTYWWEDDIETAEEYLCLVKSTQAAYDALEAAIKDAHPYETPEILAIPVVAGNADYLSWIQAELREGGV